jgi:hypothetical protein
MLFPYDPVKVSTAPKNARKKFEGRGHKKNIFENDLNRFIHFQLQNNAPFALKLHLK